MLRDEGEWWGEQLNLLGHLLYARHITLYFILYNLFLQIKYVKEVNKLPQITWLLRCKAANDSQVYVIQSQCVLGWLIICCLLLFFLLQHKACLQKYWCGHLNQYAIQKIIGSFRDHFKDKVVNTLLIILTSNLSFILIKWNHHFHVYCFWHNALITERYTDMEGKYFCFKTIVDSSNISPWISFLLLS